MNAIRLLSSRRRFLSQSAAGSAAMTLPTALSRLFAAETPQHSPATAKACILVWLNGGPSHIDTFDPKPGSSTNGPWSPIRTKISGVNFSDRLPNLAKCADRLAVIRSMTSIEGDHERGYYYTHTANRMRGNNDFPTLGSVVAHGMNQQGQLPPFVRVDTFGGDFKAGPGFLGLKHAPYSVYDPQLGLENAHIPEWANVSKVRQSRRSGVLEDLNRLFARSSRDIRAGGIADFESGVQRFLQSEDLIAFSLEDEKPSVREKYGIANDEDPDEVTGPAGCLLARRLVERGVRFVEVEFDNWDTHERNFEITSDMCDRLDPALAALINDLDDRGMLEETLVVCLGEFGRTPNINARIGRDHWNKVFSAVLAGGGVRGGQVIGASDAEGAEVKDRPVTVPELYMSLLSALGIDGRQEYTTPAGRPVRLVENAQRIDELFA